MAKVNICQGLRLRTSEEEKCQALPLWRDDRLASLALRCGMLAFGGHSAEGPSRRATPLTPSRRQGVEKAEHQAEKPSELQEGHPCVDLILHTLTLCASRLLSLSRGKGVSVLSRCLMAVPQYRSPATLVYIQMVSPHNMQALICPCTHILWQEA